MQSCYFSQTIEEYKQSSVYKLQNDFRISVLSYCHAYFTELFLLNCVLSSYLGGIINSRDTIIHFLSILIQTVNYSFNIFHNFSISAIIPE